MKQLTNPPSKSRPASYIGFKPFFSRRFLPTPGGLTQLGFCRISTHVKSAASAADAPAALRAWLVHPAREFWLDDLPLVDKLVPVIGGHQQFTDADLLELPRKRGGIVPGGDG